MIRKMFDAIVFNMDIFLDVFIFWKKYLGADIILKNFTSHHILLQTHPFSNNADANSHGECLCT